MLIVYPYKMSSQSAKSLSSNLQARRVRSDGDFKNNFYQNNLVINWGNSTVPSWWKEGTKILNSSNSVERAVNKKHTFVDCAIEEVSVPKFTYSTQEAQQWVDEGHKVYGRATLTGHGGQGIRIFDSETICTPDECPLYTLDTKSKHEYRIHVFKDRVIDSQQKKKSLTSYDGIRGIRNHANGWVYAREGVTFPLVVLEQAIKAVRALKLDFGAVDIGYREIDNTAYVYEVNSAPGLHGTTLQIYTNEFRSYYDQL
jgi:hypothetical protein